MENRKKSESMNVAKRAIASAAKMAVTANVNSACHFVAYQPKLPKGAEKLRKF
ncbi:MAG: cyclic lactone autoinducer peptide [Firmicutes bacterium]|nr:cyclic lactone autoinducer peptide [Bacillota bacterium]